MFFRRVAPNFLFVAKIHNIHMMYCGSFVLFQLVCTVDRGKFITWWVVLRVRWVTSVCCVSLGVVHSVVLGYRFIVEWALGISWRLVCVSVFWNLYVTLSV